jgi:hypothetical protein
MIYPHHSAKARLAADSRLLGPFGQFLPPWLKLVDDEQGRKNKPKIFKRSLAYGDLKSG